MSRARASIVVVAAIVAVACTMVAPAFAETGFSGYLEWDSVSGLPGQGTSPHGGYTTTTNKCAVCHSVHGASFAGELLLPSPVSEACSYCHVNSASGYTQVYGGDINNYYGTDLDNAHNSYDDAFGAEAGVRCTTCHSVHGSGSLMTSNDYLTQRLLVGAKTYVDDPMPNYDPIGQAPLSTDSSNTALAKWCAGCHFTKGGTYTYWGTQNGQSHNMTTATASYSNPATTETTQVAWVDSNYCASCHSSGYTTAAWPHYTEGVRFLEAAANASDTLVPSTNSKSDGVCLRCHVSGDGTRGVGIGY